MKAIAITFQDDKVNVVRENVEPIDMIFAVEALVRTAADEMQMTPEKWAHIALNKMDTLNQAPKKSH